MFNKNAQIGETMTWVVATLVIVLVLSISVFVSSTGDLFGKRVFDVKSFHDLNAQKTLSSYLITKIDSDNVYDLIKSSGKIETLEGDLAKQVFEGYENYYEFVWFGVNGEENSWFGRRPSIYSADIGDISPEFNEYIYEEIKLNKTSSVGFIFPLERSVLISK